MNQKNRIEVMHGDNILAMRALQVRRQFRLVYMDPPFFSQKTYRMGDEVAFEDLWETRSQYLSELGQAIKDAWWLLASNGSLVVHVDARISHYVKVLCDTVLGSDSFDSEIIWRYRHWPTKSTFPTFQRVHDVLLRYVADPLAYPCFNQLYEPLAESTRKTWGTSKQRAVMDGGRRKRSSKTQEESPGVPLGDVWDIGIIAASAKERTGYPTQKPEKLLERLICSLTDPGDWVLDPYCGSGTTLAVAKRTGRNAVGIDSSAVAIRVTKERLR